MAIFNSKNIICQSSKKDFNYLYTKIENKTPFTFVRFSDGELEIIRNKKLVIKKDEVIWSKGVSKHSYPAFDFKSFDPNIDFALRDDLIRSAEYRSTDYIKGIPAAHNNAVSDRDLMIRLNDNSKLNLTFADLFLNENFLKFRKLIIPKILTFKNIFYVGNFRANPKKLSNSFIHIEVPDELFVNYELNRKKIYERLINVPLNSIILLSASSLSNILGHNLQLVRSDLIVIDVGTSIHDLVGLQSGIREYHALLLSRNIKSNFIKLRYKTRKGYYLKW